MHMCNRSLFCFFYLLFSASIVATHSTECGVSSLCLNAITWKETECVFDKRKTAFRTNLMFSHADSGCCIFWGSCSVVHRYCMCSGLEIRSSFHVASQDTTLWGSSSASLWTCNWKLQAELEYNYYTARVVKDQSISIASAIPKRTRTSPAALYSARCQNKWPLGQADQEAPARLISTIKKKPFVPRTSWVMPHWVINVFCIAPCNSSVTSVLWFIVRLRRRQAYWCFRCSFFFALLK